MLSSLMFIKVMLFTHKIDAMDWPSGQDQSSIYGYATFQPVREDVTYVKSSFIG